MNKLFYLLLLLLCGNAAFSQSKKAIPAKPAVAGFRDIPWGVHIDSAYVNKHKLNFVKSSAARDQNVYFLESDDLTIGTVSLTNILYYFTDRGRFTKVVLMADKKFFNDMRYILNFKFDEPQDARVVNGNTVLQWNMDEVRITLTDGNADGQMTATFYIDYNMLEFKTINKNVTDF